MRGLKKFVILAAIFLGSCSVIGQHPEPKWWFHDAEVKAFVRRENGQIKERLSYKQGDALICESLDDWEIILDALETPEILDYVTP